MKTLAACACLLVQSAAFAADPAVAIPAAPVPAPATAPAPNIIPGDDISSLGPTPVITPAGTVGPRSLPAMNFYASIASNELFDLVRKDELFGRLDKELWGSPLTLRITHSLQPTAGGKAAGFMSAIWSGSTLGLLPVVTNNNLVVTYEIRVHGREYVTYAYQRSFTRAVNIWAKDETYGLGKDGLEWLKGTGAEFIAAASADPKLAELKKQYERYFGSL